MGERFTVNSAGRLLLVFFAATLAVGVAGAEPPAADARVQLALADPLQWVDSDRSIDGLRFSILRGVNRDVTGLDLSCVTTYTLGSFRGLQIAAANEVDGEGAGVQIGLFANYVENRFGGLQLSGLASRAGRGSGAQISAIISDAKVWKGFQIALVNRAGEMDGLQIGLLNFNGRGFLPVFPLFNFGS
jgi:hypothetical protein